MTFPLAMIAALLIPAVSLILISVLACRQIATLQRRTTRPADWTAELSVERYAPMFRLLSHEDFRFLRAQPGATPALVRRLRRQRCRLFRAYLRSLQQDFSRTSEAMMRFLMQAETDRSDLIPILIASHVRFACGLLVVRCRLLLYRWDVAQEPVARLVSVFERLQLELGALAP